MSNTGKTAGRGKNAARPKSDKPAKKAAATKSEPARSPSAKGRPAAPAKKVPAPASRAPAAPAKPAVKSPLSPKEVERFKDLLLSLRDRITGQISFLANDSLKIVDDTPSDDRTDDFDREFALNLVSSEQDAVFEIDEALRRIEDGCFGVCELSGKPIEKERLKVIPYARYCVSVQSEIEKGRTRYRPFGSTIAQTAERTTEPQGAEEQEE